VTVRVLPPALGDTAAIRSPELTWIRTVVITPTLQNTRRTSGQRSHALAESAKGQRRCSACGLRQQWMLGSLSLGTVPVGRDARRARDCCQLTARGRRGA
jgi:hypothetical protein